MSSTMADAAQPNVSQDLIWEISRKQNSFLVKRKSGGGVQFSKDPLNLMNKHSRKYAGFVNDKAVGVQPGEKGGVKLTTKKANKSNTPASSRIEVTWGPHKSGPKVYKGIVNYTAKNGYRPDLRQAAVGRASAIRKSQGQKKEAPKAKVRGAKAKKAAEKE